MTELEKKIARAVRLIQSAGKDGSVVEVAYSGGKDSDVILELTKMAGIKYRAIYKNTTIDPPQTIKHCRDNGVEVVHPVKSFFDVCEDNGLPNRHYRFCCKFLKEYKILDKCIMGVRRAESTKRAKRYKEPTECRFYGSKKEHVEAYYPILDWTDDDVVEFIKMRGIKLHPLYYRDDGTIDPKRRLGCMCCPLASANKRKEQFKKYPNMVKFYIRAAQRYIKKHPETKALHKYENVYEWFYRDVFCITQNQFNESKVSFFGKPNYKRFLEEYFNIELQ